MGGGGVGRRLNARFKQHFYTTSVSPGSWPPSTYLKNYTVEWEPILLRLSQLKPAAGPGARLSARFQISPRPPGSCIYLIFVKYLEAFV